MPSEIKIGDVRKPFVLYATVYNQTPEKYLEDSQYGDAALDAILNGRNVLVRVPSTDEVRNPGALSVEQHTALFSPVIHYQLPNHDNNFLYLFYLRDEKQGIDLSAAGAGRVEMPIYGELKLKLSRTYDECPLDHKTRAELTELFRPT